MKMYKWYPEESKIVLLLYMKKGLEWQGSISDKTPEIISVSNVLRGLDSSEIVANINAGNIKLSVIGDELFERAFGVASDVTGLAIDNKIYIRKSSITIHSDMVHEGTHALDYLRGISYSERAGWAGEIRAYTAEHHFQKAANITLEFANEDDIRVHVWKNYKRRGGK